MWLALLSWGSSRFIGSASYTSGSLLLIAARVVWIVVLAWVFTVWVPRFISDLRGDTIKDEKRPKVTSRKLPDGRTHYKVPPQGTRGSGRVGRFTKPAPAPQPGYRRSSVNTVGNMTVFGDAGSNVAGASHFGNRSDIGAQGERIVAGKLSRAFSQIPGSKLFNGVKFNPNGSSQADVDHALVLGNNLYLVDAKKYKAGTYTELPGGQLRHDGDGDIRTIKMDAARNLWARSMPGGSRLAPKSYVAVEGNNSVKRFPGSPVFMGTTEEVINEIQRDFQKNKFRGGDNSRLSSFVQSKML